MYRWKTIALLTIVTFSFAGCVDQHIVYRQTSKEGILVRANIDAYNRNDYTKTDLDIAWLEKYLCNLKNEYGTTLYDKDKLKPLLPDIHQALSEWGNVIIMEGFTRNNHIWHSGLWIYGNSVRGDFYGESWGYNATKIIHRGNIEAVTIPDYAVKNIKN